MVSVRWYSERSFANVTLPLTLLSNKLNVKFFSTLIVTAFKCILEETMPNLSGNFGNQNPQDSHKNQSPDPVCNFGFTEPQYSDKCWSNLPLKCHIFLIGNTNRSSARSSDSWSGWFVWNQLPRGAAYTQISFVFLKKFFQITLLNDCMPFSYFNAYHVTSGIWTHQSGTTPTFDSSKFSECKTVIVRFKPWKSKLEACI